jgi:Kef-type K+ transport system membrane component KefB
VVVGAQADISILYGSNGILLVTLLIVFGSIISKYLSGYFGFKIAGFSNNESKTFGAASIPQLSTTLAVAFTGFELGLFGQPILTSMIILSVVTTFLGPVLMRALG